MSLKFNTIGIVNHSAGQNFPTSNVVHRNKYHINFQADNHIKNLKNNFENNETKFILGEVALAGIIGLGLISHKAHFKTINKYEWITNPELLKTTDFKMFKNFKICKNLNTMEKKKFHYLTSRKDCGYEMYLALFGKKPVGEILNLKRKNISFINKLELPEGIEVFCSYTDKKRGINPKRGYIINFVNKPELFKVFERNKEVFTKRLGLDINADNETIYAKVKNYILQHKEAHYVNTDKNMHDLFGLCMGFPKENTMIFQLEQAGNISSKLRKNPCEYKKQILAVLHGDNSPYKNLSKEELDKLENAINNISFPEFQSGKSYTKCVKYTDEPKEFRRIITADKEFDETFSIEKMIAGIYS